MCRHPILQRSATLAELDRLCEVAKRERPKVDTAKHLAARQEAEAKAPYNCPSIHHIQGAEVARDEFYAQLWPTVRSDGVLRLDAWRG